MKQSTKSKSQAIMNILSTSYHSVNDPLVNSDHSFNFCGKKREGWGGEDNPINAPQLSSIAWHFSLSVFIISHKFS